MIEDYFSTVNSLSFVISKIKCFTKLQLEYFFYINLSDVVASTYFAYPTTYCDAYSHLRSLNLGFTLGFLTFLFILININYCFYQYLLNVNGYPR